MTKTVYFVSSHSGCQATPQSATPSGELLQTNTQVSPLPAGVLQSRLPHTAVQKVIWGHLQQLVSRLCPQHDCDNTRTKRSSHSISSTGSGHHNTSHTPYKGDNGQRTLRKDKAGIHIKKSSHQKYQTHGDYIGTLPNKNNPSKPQ